MTPPVIVLAGGLGTRLRSSVPNLPKVMAPAAGRPFLAWLLDNLAAQGVERCILSLGHGAEAVTEHLARARDLPPNLAVETVVEREPLGTGGALRHAIDSRGLEGAVLVLNGDTYLPTGISQLRQNFSDTVLGLVEVPDTARYGRVTLDAEGRVVAFEEKGRGGKGLINAGLLRLDSAELATAPPGAFSLETTILTRLSEARRLIGRKLQTGFIDIGVPEDYKRFCAWAAAGFAE